MSWTAVVPLKQGGDRKSRLAGLLSYDDRLALSDRMAIHVLSVLIAAPSVTRVLGLSATPPPMAEVDWARDEGSGLNAELEVVMARPGIGRLLILHGDLPLVEVGDVEALVAAAVGGLALAPDRHGTGTNAMAVSGKSVRLAFGENSFDRHMASIWPTPVVVRRPGLAVDIDTPEDLRAAIEAGFVFDMPEG